MDLLKIMLYCVSVLLFMIEVFDEKYDMLCFIEFLYFYDLII